MCVTEREYLQFCLFVITVDIMLILSQGEACESSNTEMFLMINNLKISYDNIITIKHNNQG